MALMLQMRLLAIAILVFGYAGCQPPRGDTEPRPQTLNCLLLRGPKEARVDSEFTTTVEVIADEIEVDWGAPIGREFSLSLSTPNAPLSIGPSLTYSVVPGCIMVPIKYHKGDIITIRWRVRDFFKDARGGQVLEIRVEAEDDFSNTIRVRLTE